MPYSEIILLILKWERSTSMIATALNPFKEVCLSPLRKDGIEVISEQNTDLIDFKILMRIEC
jgi:hypothetical protein